MTPIGKNEPQDDMESQKLNLETGKISWPELQRFFARGAVIIVSKPLDLVEVARQFSEDNKDFVKDHMARNLIRPATDKDAIKWNETQQQFWAVVTAPWVLVQAIDQAG